MNRFYVPALVLVVAVIVVSIMLAAGRLVYFVDYPSFIIAFIPAILLSLATFTPADIARSFRACMGKTAAPEKDLKAAVVFFRAAQRYLFFSAGIGALIGVISMLSQIQDMKAIGMGFAILLTCVFYAIVLTLTVALPFRAAAERKLAELTGGAR
jgi:flagellar motor component MotA